MKINKEKTIDDLGLTFFGGKGWMRSPDLVCTECGKAGKFGILFSEETGVVHCFKCGHSDSLVKFLKSISKSDLIIYETEISLTKKLKTISRDQYEPKELPEVKLPKGFKHITNDEYLRERGFESYQYEQFEVGVTNHFLEKRLHNYLIFVIKQNRRTVGWLARSRQTKEWHEENLRQNKEEGVKLHPRYLNSSGTDFDHILGGVDELTDNTHTVIAVEGLFDKTNISNILKTNEYEELKVLFTFGNKFSEPQIYELRKSNVKTIYLMYDEGTIQQSKQYSMELSKYFEVFVCYIDDPKIDPGNMDKNYLSKILDNAENYLYFYTSKINSKIKS